MHFSQPTRTIPIRKTIVFRMAVDIFVFVSVQAGLFFSFQCTGCSEDLSSIVLSADASSTLPGSDRQLFCTLKSFRFHLSELLCCAAVPPAVCLIVCGEFAKSNWNS